MKRIICSALCAVMLIAALVPCVTAGAVYRLKPDDRYEPNVLAVFLKREYANSSCDAGDFPELPVVRVGDLSSRNVNGVVALYLPADPGITMQEALNRVAGNPMVASAMPILDVDYIEMTWILPGDANSDDRVNAKDVTAVMEYLLNDEEVIFNPKDYRLNLKGLGRADANGDGVINAKDVTWIMRLILG